MFWNYKIQFILLQKKILKNSGKLNGAKIGTAELAELKLLTVLLYFIILNVCTLVIDSYMATLVPETFLNDAIPYFTCESVGRRECESLLSDIQQPHLYNLSVAVVALAGFLPLVVFINSNNFKPCIKCVKKLSNSASGSAKTLFQHP